jgi:uncharacterized membrane protein YcaP (DUF421 family)
MDALFGIKDHITLAQECARAVVVFFYGLILLRLSGRRTFAQWSALDIVISIIVGSSLARAMTASAPFGGTLAAVALLMLLHTLFSVAISRSEWLSDIVEGNAVPLAHDGRLDDEARRQHFISNEDLEQALRQRGVERVDQTRAIHLEADGKISVIKTDV